MELYELFIEPVFTVVMKTGLCGQCIGLAVVTEAMQRELWLVIRMEKEDYKARIQKDWWWCHDICKANVINCRTGAKNWVEPWRILGEAEDKLGVLYPDEVDGDDDFDDDNTNNSNNNNSSLLKYKSCYVVKN